MLKLSIIIPVFNKGPYIKNCLKSVLMQMNDEVEVIIVDDTDLKDTDTSSFMTEVQQKSLNIRYFRGPSNGVSAARNLGIDKSNGQYILFLDADDTLIPCAIPLILRRIDQLSPTDVIYFNYNHINPKTSNPIISYVYSDVWPHLPMTTRERDNWIWCLVGNKIGRTSFLKENNLRFNESLYRFEDDHFAFDALKASKSIIYTTDFIINYNDLISGSLSKTANIDHIRKSNREGKNKGDALLKSGELTIEIGSIILSKIR